LHSFPCKATGLRPRFRPHRYCRTFGVLYTIRGFFLVRSQNQKNTRYHYGFTLQITKRINSATDNKPEKEKALTFFWYDSRIWPCHHHYQSYIKCEKRQSRACVSRLDPLSSARLIRRRCGKSYHSLTKFCVSLKRLQSRHYLTPTADPDPSCIRHVLPPASSSRGQ
jgi:hypothetical protein